MARIVILTGAGISAESGIQTFRAADGLWEEHRIEDVATPEAFQRDPAMVHRFYNMRRRRLLESDVDANDAHRALGRLQRELPGQVLIVTQNIDDLHERGGATDVLHMHGELLQSWCLACDAKVSTRDDVDTTSVCPACGAVGRLRPDIVWFGEIPYEMDRIQTELAQAEIFVSIGTSGLVYPAAGFVQFATAMGAHTVELNLEPTPGMFAEVHRGPATVVVPEWVDSLLSGRGPAAAG